MQRAVLVPAILLLCLITCSRTPAKVPADPEDKLVRADRLADEGDCRRAVLLYDEILSEFPTPEVAERSRFGRAECRLELEDYDLAIDELEDFIDSYPGSDLADDAMYMIAVCYIAQAPRAERDQQNTVKAIEELEFLLREYPESNVRPEAEASRREARGKLAHKEYLNGKLYLRLGYERAARVSFDIVIGQYSDTEWAPWALLGKAQTFDREGRAAQAIELYGEVADGYPDTEPGMRASMRLAELSKESGTGDGESE